MSTIYFDPLCPPPLQGGVMSPQLLYWRRPWSGTVQYSIYF